MITKKIWVKTATFGAAPPADAAPIPASGIDAFTATQPPRLGGNSAVPKPTAADLRDLRRAIEGGAVAASTVTPEETLAVPHVPAFREELRPLLPGIAKEADLWKSTLDDIENHYAARRRELEADRLDSLQQIAANTDTAVVLASQRRLKALEAAIARLHQELLALQGYRRHELAKMG